MNVKLKRALIDLSGGFLWLAAFACLCFYASSRFLISAWAAFLVGAAGLIINYYLFVFFHELGHVAFSGRAGLKPIKINYGIFTIDYLKNLSDNFDSDSISGADKNSGAKNAANKKITLSPLFNKNSGEGSFAPYKLVSQNDVKTVAFGGLLFSFIYCLAAFFVILFLNNAWLFCLFGAGACSAFYVFSINVIPLDKTNDGSLVLFNDYCEELAKMLRFSHLLSENADIGEFEKLIDFSEDFKKTSKTTKQSAFSKYIKYFVTAEKSAEQAVFALNNSPLKNLGGLCDEELFTVLSELVFAACFFENSAFLSENSSLIEGYFCADFGEPTLCAKLAFVRAHAAYRAALKNAEWALALEQTYKELIGEAISDKAFPQIALRVENNLFDFYKKTYSKKSD